MSYQFFFDRLVECPTCGAPLGSLCESRFGTELRYVHVARVRKAERQPLAVAE